MSVNRNTTLGTSAGLWLVLLVLVPAPPCAAQPVATSPARAQGAKTAPVLPAPTVDDCLGCHEDPDAKRQDGRSVAVVRKDWEASIHGQGGMSCVDCHADLARAELPHAENLAPVNCAACHDASVQALATSVHGRPRSGRALAARCVDCHGTHDIRGSKDPDSRTYHLNVPSTCGRCHGNPDRMKRAGGPQENVFSEFEDSIHGRALFRAGLLVAPDCTNCHGAHDVRPRTDPSSRVYRTSIPATCGACHQGIERQYSSGIHGARLAAGNPLAPQCADCHTAHTIARVETESWRLDVIRECGTCHAEAIRTYRDTYHGQVTSLGFERVAKCADCHGAHEVHPKADPRSLVSAARRVSTCQKCHAGATARFARYDPHADRHNRVRNPLYFHASRFMDVLLIGVFSFFALHTGLWASRTVGTKRRAPAARQDRSKVAQADTDGPAPGAPTE